MAGTPAARYLISLIAPLLILLIAIAIFMVWCRCAPSPRIGCCITAFLPGIGDHDLAAQCRRGDRLDWRRLRPVQDRHGLLPVALLTTVFFWLFHVSSFDVETRSWRPTALAPGEI